jgi:hypothetical protein
MSKITRVCAIFLGLYIATLISALVTSEPSGVVNDFAAQITLIRLPLNLLLLLWLGCMALLKKKTATIWLVAALFNWILVIDDYFVLRMQDFPFESILVQALAALRPFVAAAISLIAFEVKIKESETAT